MLRALGIQNASSYRTRDLRRGHAKDLQLSNAPLSVILRANFFTRMGFDVVDRWSISPKVWQASIYCSKFHRCDEVAVLMQLVEKPVKEDDGKPPAWNGLLRWDSWQPLKLAYHKPDPEHRKS